MAIINNQITNTAKPGSCRTLFHIILVFVDKALTLFPHHCVFYEGEMGGSIEEPSNSTVESRSIVFEGDGENKR